MYAYINTTLYFLKEKLKTFVQIPKIIHLPASDNLKKSIVYLYIFVVLFKFVLI